MFDFVLRIVIMDYIIMILLINEHGHELVYVEI